MSQIKIADSTVALFNCRAPNNAAGKCWMDALELALRCSSLLLRTMSATNTLPKAANANGENGDNGQVRLVV